MPLGVVGSLDNLADMTGAIFTSHVAVVVQQISHGIASSERVEVRVDGNLVQVPTDVVRHCLVETASLEHHGDGLAVLERS